MKSVLVGFVSAVLLLTLQAQAASDRIVGYERTSECTANESSLVETVTITHGANPYSLEAMSAKAEGDLITKPVSAKTATFTSLEKKKILNFTTQSVQDAANFNTLEVSVDRDRAHEGSFTAVVSVEKVVQGRKTQSVADFNCRLTSHKDLRFSDLF